MIRVGFYIIGLAILMALSLGLISKLPWDSWFGRYVRTYEISNSSHVVLLLGCVAGITLILTGLVSLKIGADRLATNTARFAAKGLIGGICTLLVTTLSVLILMCFARGILDSAEAFGRWGPRRNRPRELSEWVGFSGGAVGIILVLAGLFAIPFSINSWFGIGVDATIIGLIIAGVRWVNSLEKQEDKR